MQEKFEKVKRILEEQNQEDLLKYNVEFKDELLDDILKTNFEQLNKLYKKTITKQEKENIKIDPIGCIDKEKLSNEEKEKYEKIGKEIIKKGQFAVVTAAGGQGSRLGHNGPKGTFDFGLQNHKTIFEVLCDGLKKSYKKYNIYVQWYIMTSEQNNTETIEFFEKNNYFNYPKEKIKFFKQGQLPVLSKDGKLLLNKDGLINKAADGHGGIFIAMRKNKIINDMKDKNIKWALFLPVDNVLVKMVDAMFLGICASKNVQIGGKSIIKAYPEERVGVFCKENGKPSVVEYTEISKEMAEQRDEKGNLVFGESHINCNMYTIDAIEEISKDKLPYHVAIKKIEYLNKDGKVIKPNEPNAYKFESFGFDSFKQFDDMVIFRVKREEEFAPIKNAEGNDSPETARRLYIQAMEKN